MDHGSENDPYRTRHQNEISKAMVDPVVLPRYDQFHGTAVRADRETSSFPTSHYHIIIIINVYLWDLNGAAKYSTLGCCRDISHGTPKTPCILYHVSTMCLYLGDVNKSISQDHPGKVSTSTEMQWSLLPMEFVHSIITCQSEPVLLVVPTRKTE